MNIYDTPDAVCAECGKLQPCAVSANGEARPEGGSLTLCADCGALNIYTERLTLRAPSAAEIKPLRQDAHLWRFISDTQHNIRLAARQRSARLN